MDEGVEERAKIEKKIRDRKSSIMTLGDMKAVATTNRNWNRQIDEAFKEIREEINIGNTVENLRAISHDCHILRRKFGSGLPEVETGGVGISDTTNMTKTELAALEDFDTDSEDENDSDEELEVVEEIKNEPEEIKLADTINNSSSSSSSSSSSKKEVEKIIAETKKVKREKERNEEWTGYKVDISEDELQEALGGEWFVLSRSYPFSAPDFSSYPILTELLEKYVGIGGVSRGVEGGEKDAVVVEVEVEEKVKEEKVKEEKVKEEKTEDEDDNKGEEKKEEKDATQSPSSIPAKQDKILNMMNDVMSASPGAATRGKRSVTFQKLAKEEGEGKGEGEGEGEREREREKQQSQNIPKIIQLTPLQKAAARAVAIKMKKKKREAEAKKQEAKLEEAKVAEKIEEEKEEKNTEEQPQQNVQGEQPTPPPPPGVQGETAIETAIEAAIETAIETATETPTPTSTPTATLESAAPPPQGLQGATTKPPPDFVETSEECSTPLKPPSPPPSTLGPSYPPPSPASATPNSPPPVNAAGGPPRGDPPRGAAPRGPPPA